MIGQTVLLGQLNNLIADKKFPQFAIFIGEDGIGKKTLMNEVANNWRFSYTCDDVKVDTIRQMMKFAYATASTERCVYIMPDAHKMSANAKNAILKIVEEPPKSATFLMSANSESAILSTIKSRGACFYLNNYTDDEKRKALESVQDSLDCDYIVSVANTIADCIELTRIDLDALQKHINTLIDKADAISMANLLKSSHSIAFKDEEEGFPLKLYLRAFQAECLKRLKSKKEEVDDVWMYRDMIVETSSKLNDLAITGINKQMLYENWLINISDIEEKYGDNRS